MELQFFGEALDGRPIILLYGGTADEVRRLRTAVSKVAECTERQLAIHDLAFVEPVGSLALTAVSADFDQGVSSVRRGVFRWVLSSNSWSDIIALLDPFTLHSNSEHCSFQYLNPSDGPEVIYSTGRGW